MSLYLWYLLSSENAAECHVTGPEGGGCLESHERTKSSVEKKYQNRFNSKGRTWRKLPHCISSLEQKIQCLIRVVVNSSSFVRVRGGGGRCPGWGWGIPEGPASAYGLLSTQDNQGQPDLLPPSYGLKECTQGTCSRNRLLSKTTFYIRKTSLHGLFTKHRLFSTSWELSSFLFVTADPCLLCFYSGE